MRTGALSDVAPRSPSPEHISDDWPLVKRLRRALLMPLFRIPDSGFLGLTPLKTHIIICGFPRAGTTLLQMMLENAYPGARRFGCEVGAWRAATYAFRNHPLMLSKVPHDVARLDAVRNFYAGRSAKAKIIVVIRDPRNVLTSRRNFNGVTRYCVDAARWRHHYQHVRRNMNAPDVLVVRYENMVRDVDLEQSRIEAFVGEKISHPFRAFHEIERADFDMAPLNGLRPVESSLLQRWRAPEHRARIEQMLSELHELRDALVELGYEQDHHWQL